MAWMTPSSPHASEYIVGRPIPTPFAPRHSAFTLLTRTRPNKKKGVVNVHRARRSGKPGKDH
jgi:hypothetical protein